MRALLILLGLLIFCVVCWLIAGALSPDVIPLAVMLFFGLLAGIPTAALIMASNRPRVREDNEDEEEYTQPDAPFMNPYPPAPAPVYSDIDDWFPQPYHDSPRVIGLPTSVEQQRFRRRAEKGVIKKLTDDSGPVPPGFRRLRRTDGKIAVMD